MLSRKIVYFYDNVPLIWKSLTYASLSLKEKEIVSSEYCNINLQG